MIVVATAVLSSSSIMKLEAQLKSQEMSCS